MHPRLRTVALPFVLFASLLLVSWTPKSRIDMLVVHWRAVECKCPMVTLDIGGNPNWVCHASGPTVTITIDVSSPEIGEAPCDEDCKATTSDCTLTFEENPEVRWIVQGSEQVPQTCQVVVVRASNRETGFCSGWADSVAIDSDEDFNINTSGECRTPPGEGQPPPPGHDDELDSYIYVYAACQGIPGDIKASIRWYYRCKPCEEGELH